jgi:hypothetical protein
MEARSGQEYLQGLPQTKRRLWLEGAPVEDDCVSISPPPPATASTTTCATRIAAGPTPSSRSWSLAARPSEDRAEGPGSFHVLKLTRRVL